MFCSFVRSVTVIALAFTCGTAQAGLVVFDSTANQTAARIGTEATNLLPNFRLVSSSGITFTVGQTAILLQNATFGVYGSNAGPVDLRLSLYLGSQTNTSDRSLTRQNVSISTNASGGTAVAFAPVGGWLLNAGTQYTLAIRRVNADQTRLAYIATTTAPQEQLGLNFNYFNRSGSSTTDRYWIQLNAFDDPAVVPEPATIGLLIGGLGIGLGQRIRRRRRKASIDGVAEKSATAFGNPLHRLKAALSC